MLKQMKRKPTTTPEEFAFAVKAWRTSRGFSQQQAADHLGVKRVTIARWETRKQRPGKMTVLALLPKLN